MSWRAIFSAALVGVLVGCALGWFAHGAPARTPSVRVAQHDARVATHHADTAVAHERVDSARTIVALAPLEVAIRTVDMHDSASVTRLIAAATVAAPACRDLVASSSAAVVAKDSVIAAKDREIAARAAMLPPRLTASMLALYDPVAGKPDARVEANLHLVSHLSAAAEVERGLSLTDSARVRVGARWTF